MQRYSCNVRPGGDLIHEVPKEDVSAAEIMVLTHIHGEGSVVHIEPKKMDRVKSKVEYERLVEVYGPERVGQVFGNGFGIKLPSKLDLGVEEEDEELGDEDLEV